MRTQVQSLASFTGLMIWHCRELWHRSQMQLRSGVALAVVEAGGYSSDSTPSLETSICLRYSLKKTKKKLFSQPVMHILQRCSGFCLGVKTYKVVFILYHPSLLTRCHLASGDILIEWENGSEVHYTHISLFYSFEKQWP